MEPQKAALAKVVLMTLDGAPEKAIAKSLSMSEDSVALWRQRFIDSGLPGLFGQEAEAAPEPLGPMVSRNALRELLSGAPPNGEPHWTLEILAGRLGIDEEDCQELLDDNAMSLEKIRLARIEAARKAKGKA